MKNYLDNFIKTNKEIFKMNNSKKNILLVERGRFLNDFRNIVGASILSHKKKLDVILISDKKKESNSIKFFYSFGIKKHFQGFSFKFAFQNLFSLFKSFIFTFFSLLKLKKYGFFWFVKNLKIKNISIGDLVYDSYYRNGHKYLSPKIDFDLSLILFKTIFRTLIISKYIDKYNIKFIFIGTHMGPYNSSIALRLGVSKNLKVLEVQENRVKLYTKKSINLGSLEVLSQNFIKNLKQKIKIQKINMFLNKRLKNKVTTMHTGNKDILTSNRGKKLISKNKILNKFNIPYDKIKKIVLIAPHAFSDGCHSHAGYFIFADYYEHYKETLNFISSKNYSDILWIVRPHPTSPLYGESGIAENLVKKIKKKNIIICPPNLKTSALINICDNVITGRGTIGLEFACKGKYPITAGNSVYKNFGFSKISNTKNEYFKIISQIIKIPKLNQKQINMAKRVLYLLESTKTLRNSQIFQQVINDGNDIKIFKKLNKTLKSIKLQEDIFYKDLKKNLNFI